MNPAIREFLRAAADGDIGRVRALLVQGADVDSTNGAGQTALILATAFQHIEVVELLLKANANIEHQDELGLTAFDWAKPAPEILELLEAPPKPVVQSQSRRFIESPVIHSTPEPEVLAPPPVVEAPVETTVKETPPSQQLETPATPIHRLRISPERTGEEPALRGLAAAILRDHKPRHPEPVFEPTARKIDKNVPEVHQVTPDMTVDEPTPYESTPAFVGTEEEYVEVNDVHALTPDVTVDEPTPYESTPAFVETEEEYVEVTDDTLGGPIETSDDTLAKKVRPLSSSRIFDLDAPEEPARPLSKVQVNVPQNTNGTRNGVLVWLLVILVLAGGGYGGYRVASSLLTKQSQAAATPTAPTNVAQPKVEMTKRPPVVDGDFSGTELYLPDAAYPAGATVQDGTVRVEVRVSRKGIVVGARALEGDESLKAAAEAAAKSSAFSPEKLEDKPAMMTGTITYHFNASLKTPASNDTNNGEVTATAGGPLAGAELKLVQPDKPASFKDTEAEDKVTIVIRVNRSGRVVSWRPVDGAQALRGVSVQAAKKSTFAPDKLPDTGDVVGTITYNFH